MATNSLYPSFCQFHYHSDYGKHIQTLPTRQWSAPSGGHPSGTFLNWLGSAVDAEDMINNLTAAVIGITDTHTIWDYTIIYNFPAVPPALPNPVAIFQQNVAGIVTHTAAVEAIQNTYTFFDTGFGTFKFVLLDCDAEFGLAPVLYGALPTPPKTVVDILMDDVWGWSSRGNLRPNVMRRVVSKPNDKLRREYNLT
jgi:hypothetical protein